MLKEEELEAGVVRSPKKAQIGQQKDFMNTFRGSIRQQQLLTQQLIVLMAQTLNTLKKD